MTALDRFAANMLRARRRRKLSQIVLARKLRVSPSYLSMLERGRRSPPLLTLDRIARALGTTASKLLA